MNDIILKIDHVSKAFGKKVVLAMKGKPKTIGFIYKNQKCNAPKSNYVNTVDEVERITGIDFFTALPDDIEQQVEQQCDLNEW